MSKLTDTQLIVLSKAAQRDDGAAVLPEKLAKAAAAKVGASLVGRKLMREIRSKPGMPVWRMSDDDRPLSLVILKAGRDTIGVAEDAGEHMIAGVADATSKPKAKQRNATAAQIADVTGEDQPIAASPCAGTKQASVISMLSTEQGATLDALTGATGWLPHTMRAALTGLRKRGFLVERVSEKGKPTIYRIVGQTKEPSTDKMMAA